MAKSSPPKKPDYNQTAKSIVEQATGEAPKKKERPATSKALAKRTPKNKKS